MKLPELILMIMLILRLVLMLILMPTAVDVVTAATARSCSRFHNVGRDGDLRFSLVFKCSYISLYRLTSTQLHVVAQLRRVG